jgi:hypothetical protein
VLLPLEEQMMAEHLTGVKNFWLLSRNYPMTATLHPIMLTHCPTKYWSHSRQTKLVVISTRSPTTSTCHTFKMAFGRMKQKFQIMRRKMTCSLATQSLYIQTITRLHNFIIDNDSLPECYGQPANINANGEFDAEELKALGIQPLPDNLGAGGFTAVAYNANGSRSRRREEIVARLTADDIRRP